MNQDKLLKLTKQRSEDYRRIKKIIRRLGVPISPRYLSQHYFTYNWKRMRDILDMCPWTKIAVEGKRQNYYSIYGMNDPKPHI
ncbi:MAG: hypothetical protein ABEK17_03765 [Candidatus Aenigmatarchaeota archaeon]